ncbi:RNA polymerase sigma factor [Kaistia sp. UC242_56]|uniref:RNA polymerase sigma factor n=1 Tax=Kaistia sp. UC242_56 TaxID=3374625 RepID=UPI0037AC5CD4
MAFSHPDLPRLKAATAASIRYRLIPGGKAGESAGEDDSKGRADALAGRDDPGDDKAIQADHALMQAVAAGEEGAFARLIQAEAPKLTRFVASVLSDLAEAEEVVQEALLRLWKQAATWEPNARIGTFLHQVAYRIAIDRLRRRRPHLDIDGFDDILEDDAPTPERHLTQKDDGRVVQAALDQLSERQRTVIVLAHFQELGQAEGADIMGIGEHAYESLLARARRRLRSLLGGKDGDDRQEGMRS